MFFKGTTYSMIVPAFVKAQCRFVTCMLVDYCSLVFFSLLFGGSSWSTGLHQSVVLVDHNILYIQLYKSNCCYQDRQEVSDKYLRELRLLGRICPPL